MIGGRRRPRAWIVAATTLLVVCAAAYQWGGPLWKDQQTRSEQRKLAVLVILDTLRADHLGCYGRDPSPSPNLDAFARRSFVFDHMASASVHTFGTHTALFRSLYPTFAVQAGEAAMKADFPSLPGLLKSGGVHTAVFGHGPIFRVAAVREFETSQAHDKGRAGIAALIEWLAARGADERDVFVFLHLYDVHDPYYESPRLLDADYHMADRDERLRFHAALKARGTAEMIKAYDEGIAYVDHFMGILLRQLDQLSETTDVLTLITSDHGEAFGEHRGFFGHTKLVYQEVVHVPLLIAHSRTAGGRTIATPVSTVDLAPTILQHFDLPVPTYFQGRELLSLLDGGAADRPTVVFAEDRSGREKMIRNQHYKLIYDSQTRRSELYDLIADPAETRDIAATHADLAATLLSDLLRYYDSEGQRLGMQNQMPLRNQRHIEEQLRALGYTE